MADRWEARSALRYGSRHEGYFPSRDAARQFARRKIKAAGGVGKIETIIGHVVYYTEYEDDEC